MGLKLNINFILRTDAFDDVNLVVGQEYKFEKPGLHLISDTLQIWLTKKDWTVLADIQVTSLTRANDLTSGTFVVKHVYTGNEQKTVTEMFRRMYGSK